MKVTTWAYETSECFELINLHDGYAEVVRRADNWLAFSLGDIVLMDNHPLNPGSTHLQIPRAVLAFIDVHKELIEYTYIESPRQGIQVCRSKGMGLLLSNSLEPVEDGFTKYILVGNGETDSHWEPWMRWDITAKSFCMKWMEFSGDSWLEKLRN